MSRPVYLSRTWSVRPGLEDDFLRLWRQSADDLARRLPDATFHLWRDTRDPLRYQSVGGPVASQVELDAIRGSERFIASMEGLAEVLESVEIACFELVDEVG